MMFAMSPSHGRFRKCVGVKNILGCRFRSLVSANNLKTNTPLFMDSEEIDSFFGGLSLLL